MKKVALVFLLAVFAPSLVLAWLAVRSLRDQQFVIERQQSLLCQGVADTVAKEINDALAERHRDFNGHVESWLATHPSSNAPSQFDARLRDVWPLAEVGFVVSTEGQIHCPTMFGGAEARKFRIENDRFFCCETMEVYWNSPKGAINLSKLDALKDDARKISLSKDEAAPTPEAKGDGDSEKTIFATKAGKLPRAPAPAKEPPPAKLSAEPTEFRQLIGDSTEGTLARFLQNKLKLLFWYRAPRDPQLVFGAQLNLGALARELQPLVRVEPALAAEICLALLDDTGRPLASSRAEFKTDGKRPFAAADIGEVLPHWQVAAYLLNPARMSQAARTLRLTASLLIALLLLAIGVGGWLLVADLRRHLALARQKTDFVSNVSHELKTPLTSIRMFSELLAEGRVQDDDKRRQFLHIISAETARLSRLINNVLDFARLEHGEEKYQFAPCDLAALVRATVEAYRPHLEANGYQLECLLPSAPVPVRGDGDALAQVLVNLLSNAEKYGGEPKEMAVHLAPPVDGRARVQVLDRGLGVPKGGEEKIFEQFYRAHDSLASGIQGSGLGLTLARQIARAHGGEVSYQPREGGGSCFTLELPSGGVENKS